MGTRADFYVGRGEDAEWLGSIGYDGYPSGPPEVLLRTRGEGSYRAKVAKLLSEVDSSTMPDQGWPWPWNNSQTTDYAYAWDEDTVWYSCFGHEWISAAQHRAIAKCEEILEAVGLYDADIIGQVCASEKVAFPDMTDIQEVALDGRSGLLFVGG